MNCVSNSIWKLCHFSQSWKAGEARRGNHDMTVRTLPDSLYELDTEMNTRESSLHFSTLRLVLVEGGNVAWLGSLVVSGHSVRRGGFK